MFNEFWGGSDIVRGLLPEKFTCQSCKALNFLTGSSKVRTAALKGWTLLLSCCPSWRLDGQFCSRYLQSISPHLQEKDVDERNAAGEAVALFFTMAGLSGPSNEGTDDDSGERSTAFMPLVAQSSTQSTPQVHDTVRNSTLILHSDCLYLYGTLDRSKLPSRNSSGHSACINQHSSPLLG